MCQITFWHVPKSVLNKFEAFVLFFLYMFVSFKEQNLIKSQNYIKQNHQENET